MTPTTPRLSPHHWPERFHGLELLASAVALLDAGRHIVYLNPAAENLFAVSAIKLVGKHCDRLI
ncbi:PAS domain-containing protein, partial [Parvimonas sp. M20]